MDEKLLDIQDLSVWYKTYRGFAEVVDHINLYVGKGEKIGLVGESGCGKTTTMKMVMRTLDERGIKVGEGSKLLFGGEDILAMDAKALLDLRRRKISMISQSPMAALNPVFTIGQQMMDVLKYSGQFDKHDKKGMLDAARKAIDSVMIPDPDRILNSYPHQLSGGMRQRICIATSLLTPRQLLIADEPGTALDVTVQGQIHKLLRRLVEEEKRSLIMITHSLGVVRSWWTVFTSCTRETSWRTAIPLSFSKIRCIRIPKACWHVCRGLPAAEFQPAFTATFQVM